MQRTKSTLIVVALFLAACTHQQSATPNSGDITFIHLNDTYRVGAVESGSAGGFGRVVTLIRQLQSEGREVRILHGGDFLYPSLESQLWNGQQMVDAFNFMNELAPMFVVAGNHEFDRRTPAQLIDAVRASKFEWLGDNYRFRTDDDAVDAALKSTNLFEHGGRKVGIFALTLHPDHGGNDRDYVPIDKDYSGVAERAIRELERAGANLIIGLTHLHARQDRELAKLKASHPIFQFIVGGHEHEPEYYPADAGTAAVMKGASNARVIWRIDMSFDAGGAPVLVETRKIALNNEIAADSEYAVLEDKWRSRLLDKFPFLTSRVGEAALPLDAREETIRNEESSWGNFVVDQMRGAFGEPVADLAFINSGTLRIDDFISGDIHFEDIGRTFGFSSFLRYMTVSGAEFRQLLEAGYRGTGPSKGYFPQVSGFRVCVDPSLDEGRRIVSLQLPTDPGWTEISATDEYTLVAPDYLYGGGDGYTFPANRSASRPGSELKYLVLDAVMAAQAQGKKVGEPVNPANPRIVVIDTPGDDCWQ